MKQLIILVVGVVLLLASWWILGLIMGAPSGPAKLILPTDPNDKPALIRSAHQLWRATPDYYDSAEVLAFLGRLCDSLDRNQWRAVTAASFFAWENQRGIVGSRGLLTQLNAKLLPRFANEGTLADLEGLIRVANTGAFDAAPINALLEGIVSAPLPASGYDDTRASEVIAASIRIRDLKRAKMFLGKLKWTEGASAEAKAPVGHVHAIVDLCLAVDAGKYDFPAVVREWSSQGEGIVGRTALRPVLEEVGLLLLQTTEPSKGSRIAEHFTASAGVPDAESYWSRVVARIIPGCTQGDEIKNNNLGILIVAYGKKFEKPDFAFVTWMNIAELTLKEAPEDPLRSVALFDRALAAAQTDDQRIQAVQKVVAGCMKVLEFARARKAWAQTSALVKLPESKRKMDALQEELKKKEAADRERVVKQEKAIDLDRRRGRLQAMKDKLSAAKRSGRPAEELVAIEQVIKDLQKDVIE